MMGVNFWRTTQRLPMKSKVPNELKKNQLYFYYTSTHLPPQDSLKSNNKRYHLASRSTLLAE